MSEAAPAPRENQGQPEPRIDGRLKVTGEARYAADFPLSILAYGVLVTSAIARGRVAHINLEAARDVPGVLDIVSYGDVDQLEKPEFGTSNTTSLAPLHDTAIRHDGQIMALVVADTFEAASEAALLVTANYEEETTTATIGSRGAELSEAAGKSKMYPEDIKAGDFAAAFDAAPVKLDAEYTTAANTHNPIELFSTTAVWRDGELTIYEPTQNVYGFRGSAAKQLRMDAANVRVVSPYTGGGFGSKGPMTPRTAIVAEAARRLGRPVRCVVSRSQAFTTQTYRAETHHRIRMGATREGKITAFAHEGVELTSRIDDYVVGGTDTTGRLYGYGAVLTKVMLARADRQTPGYMRSPPETPYMFPLESAMDEMAEKAGLDPIEFRRINDTQTDPVSGKPYSSRSLMRCYDEAAAEFGWSKRSAKPGAMREGDWMIGHGCATAVYPTHIGAAAARVTLMSDGKARVETAAHEIGTGVRTVAAQMAAERLGIPVAAVTVEMGDTELPPAPVAGGSNTTATVCSTIIRACDNIRRKLAEAVVAKGQMAERDLPRLKLAEGGVAGPDGTKVSLAEAFAALGQAAIEEYGEFIPEGAPPDAVRKLYAGESTLIGGSHGKQLMYAFGAELVEVRIHASTREIRVPRMVGAFAAGRIMNTRTARSQLMGGMIWGLASALHEETQVDPRNARYVNRELQDYLVPVAADIGEIKIIMLSETDDAVNPAGVKGVGELGNVGTNAAIANAIYNATGRRLRDIPMRLEQLLA